MLIVGGGIIGLATAYQMLELWPDVEVTVLEKNADLAQEQSGHNSGVLHAGLYYTPGSAKARLAVAGIREMTAFCRDHDIAHEICGKLVVATTDAEIPRLRTLFERGTRNGLAGLRWLNASEAHAIEPAVRAVAAVHVPEEGIVDYPAVCRALAKCITSRGGRVVLNARVEALRPSWVAETPVGVFEGDLLINCAGLYCDRIARMAGASIDVRIIPFRGEYFVLEPERRHLVRHLIYPVPDPAFPFLGVHFTRHIDGGIEAGPNAVLALDMPEGRAALAYPGLWRFIAKYPKVCAEELWRSGSRRLFARKLSRLVPDIRAGDLAPGGAGVRAQAMRPNGSFVEDFLFAEQPGALHLLNAPSPGATASLAIGREIVARLQPALTHAA
ncbi:MAG TPA: L-2-hydroxyglutarate oxidase [Gemmatimonadaceae bacterium]|nr:L-2-hydroxyglutarate oxidase [Gemmatimonadaceae bacterium]